MSPFRCDELISDIADTENKNRNRKYSKLRSHSHSLTKTFEYTNPKNNRRGVACLLTNTRLNETFIYIEEEKTPSLHIQAVGRALPHPTKSNLVTGNLVLISQNTKSSPRANYLRFKLSLNKVTGLSTFTLKSADPETEDLVFLWKPRDFVYNWTMKVDIPVSCGSGFETFYIRDPVKKKNPDRDGIICKRIIAQEQNDKDESLSNYNYNTHPKDRRVDLFGIGWRKAGSSGLPRKFINFFSLRPEGDNFFNIFKGSVHEFAFPDPLNIPATKRDRRLFRNPIFITAVRSLKTKNYRIFGQIQEEWHRTSSTSTSTSIESRTQKTSCSRKSKDSFALLPLKFKRDFSDELTKLRGFEIFSRNRPVQIHRKFKDVNNENDTSDIETDQVDDSVADYQTQTQTQTSSAFNISEINKYFAANSPPLLQPPPAAYPEIIINNNNIKSGEGVIPSLPISLSSSMNNNNAGTQNNVNLNLDISPFFNSNPSTTIPAGNTQRDAVVPSIPIQPSTPLTNNSSQINTDTGVLNPSTSAPDIKRDVVIPSLPISQSYLTNITQNNTSNFISPFFSTSSDTDLTGSTPMKLSNTTEIINGFYPPAFDSTAQMNLNINTVTPSVPINPIGTQNTYPVATYPAMNIPSMPGLPMQFRSCFPSQSYPFQPQQYQPFQPQSQPQQYQYPFQFQPQQYQLPPPFGSFNSYMSATPATSPVVTTTITAFPVTTTATVTVTPTSSFTVPTSLSLNEFYI